MTAKSISVDCSRSVGRLNPRLHCANLGPGVFSADMDLTEAHREAGFSYVRTHDCPYMMPETIDIHTIFPLFYRDENDPANYRFGPTDDYLQSILATGAKVYYRLGESIEHYPSGGRFWINPPADFDKWARICVNIIRHYNDGWANGFQHGIEYWEIWNEPANGHEQWTGTREEFIQLYALASRAIKAYNPWLKVGGCSVWGDWVPPFIDRCVREKLPLDFYSHHWYGYRHEKLARQVREIRAMLDQAGLTATETHLNEWNYLPGGADASWVTDSDSRKAMVMRMTGAGGAAFIASSLIMFHDLPLEMAHFYHSSKGLYGIFDAYGNRTKVFYALKAFRRLLDTPERLAVDGGGIADGLAVLAAKAANGGMVRLLASNFEHPCGEVSVQIRQLPCAGRQLAGFTS